MVVDTLQSPLALLVVIVAGFAALVGINVLENFFGNKLKDLFSDEKYFFFFFMVFGYILYAIGEVSYYIARTYFSNFASIGISDVYWTIGGLTILASFIALAAISIQSKDLKPMNVGIITAVSFFIVLAILYTVTLREGDVSFFSYFYPLVSALIVGVSLSTVLALERSHHFSTSMMLFCLSSAAILLGDLLFTYVTAQEIVGMLRTVTDVLYVSGYGLSLIAFVMMRMHISEID